MPTIGAIPSRSRCALRSDDSAGVCVWFCFVTLEFSCKHANTQTRRTAPRRGVYFFLADDDDELPDRQPAYPGAKEMFLAKGPLADVLGKPKGHVHLLCVRMHHTHIAVRIPFFRIIIEFCSRN